MKIKESRISELDSFGNIIVKKKVLFDRGDNYTNSKAVLKMKEKQSEPLRRFAAKITKIPESVHVYSNPLMEKKNNV